MKYIGMVLGGIISVIGHIFAFIFKNVYISVRRYAMDPANKNSLWNTQAIIILCILLLCFFWLVGRYQDIWYGTSEPIFLRAIPLLLAAFMGHIIYSSPIFFKNLYSKPIIQTFLNTLSSLAFGQIVLWFELTAWTVFIVACMVIATVVLTLLHVLKGNANNTIFSKLHAAVEKAKVERINPKPIKTMPGKTDPTKLDCDVSGHDNESDESLTTLNEPKDVDLGDMFDITDSIDISKKGSLAHLRYNSEECKIVLFHTQPTKNRQSQLVTIARSDRAQHGQTLGGTGAGKTLFATNKVTQDLLNDYIGSTIIEPKGSFIRRLANFLDRVGRPYHRLDPEYEHTACLNPMYCPEGQDFDDMIEANVAAFHSYLGPDTERYFKSRSTQLLRVSIKALKLAYGNECGLNELDRLIQPLNDDYRAEVLSRLKGYDSQITLLKQYTRSMAGSPRMQEHAMQTYSNLHDYLSELTSNKHVQRIFCGPSTFNIDDVLANGEIVLVNGAYGKLSTLTYTVGRLFINLFRASIFRRSLTGTPRAHQLTVDELEMFADEEFSTFMEMAREFEVFVDVIHQGNEQLTDESKRLAAMVKQNAVQKYIMAGLENEDVKYIAEMIGEDYVIGQSSGTDEMATSGFKTQIKEEKRYIVEPKTIASLKGYNVETGAPAEVLYRGVHNNERLDPVIGLVYPLPRELFAPVDEGPTETVNVDDETEIKFNNKNILEQENQIEASEKSLRVERMKEKGLQQRSLVEVHEESPKEKIDSYEHEEAQVRIIRSSIWDDAEDINHIEQEQLMKNQEPAPFNEIKSPIKFVPASIDPTALKLAERIKQASMEKRNAKGDSGPI
ncbi:type IV secretory system conjugative DNA transfer family protein [Paenibacillus illinoisensis]|uniref:type IV secretory system conjugative DNA transfer family protein n=1 Tax=Paenibacillus illinoisensis TaxID=59845 RepID=UPI003D2E0B4F